MTTEKLEQFTRSSVLGDGHIEPIGRLTFGHCTKQLPYLEWKQNFLLDFNLSGKITKCIHLSDRYKSGKCISYHLKSKKDKIFQNFRNLYYKEKKFLNREDFIKLDEFGLAIWYMDDGNIWNRKNKSSCITINTHSFEKKDVLFMLDFFVSKWNIICTYNKSENSIRVSSKSCQNLINLINPYIVDCLKYKTVLYKLGELLEKP